MKTKQGTSSLLIGGVISYLLIDKDIKEKYRLLAIEVIYDNNICINKKKILIKELGDRQTAELNK
tara:strand:+ start:9466 stop:9660 length:195 start_codon:yes stop_codon:yes gene_type:complete